ncbi:MULTISPECIES: transporter substrate-binding domain-containing protein [unclassified Pseudomonas]|uniref:substrate-binding periplasmic protein n=1 Tax=unclassified Pseudomonas TaxID=196821 RepID=UPI002AC90DDE|nr:MULTISPECIES: transporter substrate-binding domain-containing protein [unclassified Pseudomonas]MEB0046238.1 transporter substrate-binding domain-containing protein [Pseudomonas sp. Dout3]MEB0097498.1 transporter substrate-binding domain-containing protein [Pseudomonas sp. DC1.2]WPX60788.1 transporter substrate-binding domain-containing protein [Pseudomonas sp. DC1.2]
MRLALGALLLISLNVVAADAPLRFVMSDSWAMPMVQLERGRPTQGILYDIMLSLATQVGVPAEFHVLPRARVQNAMEHGEVDVRCYVSQSWLPNQSGDYIWSIPLFVQRDLLIGRHDFPVSMRLQNMPRQPIGTVLGYVYTSLQPLFDTGQLQREDARNQEQVLAKLLAGRYHFAVSNEWTLDWFNQSLMPERQLHAVAVLQEQKVGCYVRNDPKVPVQRILRTLLRMKMSGEIDEIVRLYIGGEPAADEMK